MSAVSAEMILSFAQIGAMLRARRRLIMWVISLSMLMALVGTLVVPKTYIASSDLYIDYRVNDPINGDLAMQHAIAPVMAATLDIAYDPSVQSLSPKTYTTSAGTYDYSFLNGKTYGQALIAEWNKLCPWYQHLPSQYDVLSNPPFHSLFYS